jgi:Family of unknown function (DUF6252)
MRNALYSILMLTGLCYGLTSCSNGDYIANPNSNANGSINPLKPLKASEFTWSGTDNISLTINGSPWLADSTVWYTDTTGTNVILGKKDKDMIVIYCRNSWAGNLYNMGYNCYDRIAQWINTDSFYSAGSYYQSSLGNSGELLMVAYDSVHINGKFYFQGVNSHNQIINITEGYFNLPKM